MSFRLLSSVPLEQEALPAAAERIISSAQVGARPDAREPAVKAMSTWLETFILRASNSEEQAAWQSIELSHDPHRFGPSGQLSTWAHKRQAAMDRVNPSFVLRQWVLEETIAALEALGMAGIQEGRQALARVLDVSPLFRIWRAGLMVDGNSAVLSVGRGWRCGSEEVVRLGIERYAGISV